MSKKTKRTVETRLRQSVATSENWRVETVRARRVEGMRKAWRRRKAG
jgi:hypothetical protein